MSREEAKQRSVQIDVEQQVLHRKAMPFQLVLFIVAVANISSIKEILPPLVTHDYLIGGVLLVAAAGLIWVHLKLWKLSKERDQILEKYGIW